MYNINVEKKYNIYIQQDFDNLLNFIKKDNISHHNIAIITDNNVSKHYLTQIQNVFKFSNVFVYEIQNGEQSKNLLTIQNIYEFLLQNNIDRKSLIVALGGGVVGDIAGFVASTYMRGINFIQIPTTLLAQVDSSVGGKTGVDFLGKKNIIGAFYNPSLVYINISTLKTLPKNHIQNGMAEVIKYGYILDEDFLNFIFSEKEKIKDFNFDVLAKIIYKCCQLKSHIVFIDEKEQGIREILNFGHTFGHGIEAETNFNILHGQAVAMGMLSSLYISNILGFITDQQITQAKNILKYFDLCNKTNLNVENVYNNMIYDKKNENKKIKIIMLKKIGQAFSTFNIDKNMLIKALSYALEV